jgi:hypothetical protein
VSGLVRELLDESHANGIGFIQRLLPGANRAPFTERAFFYAN